MRHAGGDRVMAQVLAAVPVAGLEAVLVAVELVLESPAASAPNMSSMSWHGSMHPNHPQRRNPLVAQGSPRGNTARYDRLRGQEAEEVNSHA
jgi:hypothetical protein